MSELVALGFDSEAEADRFGDHLSEMAKARILQLRDAAQVLLGESGKPRVRHANELVGAGTLGGVFWGAFFALVFFVPGLGPLIGACLWLAREHMGTGLEREFIEQLTSAIKPGQAGWVLLVGAVDEERFVEALRGTAARVVRSTLTADGEAALREVFGAGERPPK